MKKLVIVFFLIGNFVTATSQDLTTNKSELTTDEQRLSILFAKYKTCETTVTKRVNIHNTDIDHETKWIVEDIQFSNYGTINNYYRKITQTKNWFNTTGEINNYPIPMVSISSTDFDWKNVSFLKYYIKTGALSIQAENDDFGFEHTDITRGYKYNLKGKVKDFLTYFKPSVRDTDGQAKKDVLEIISLIKKIVKFYGGKDVKVEINEN